MPPPTCIGIIPARYESSRFPGKPLADILGRPMFWHVYTRACRCPALERVYLATDDDRIHAAAERLAVPVVMTRPDHPSGTDRVLEAARLLGLDKAPDTVVVNIQGDEPALAPEMLTELVAPFADPQVQTTTLAHPIDAADSRRPDQVKVVRAASGRALYFSRAAIPYPQADPQTPAYLGHVGLYAHRFRRLVRFAGMRPSPLERVEKLEQLRLLENDLPVHVVVTRHRSVGVDRPEDLERVRHLLEAQGDLESRGDPR
jgi:3-deoxy-manno-octulosonate cytidylyltransferase (CMP-KDO synthetase)